MSFRLYFFTVAKTAKVAQQNVIQMGKATLAISEQQNRNTVQS